MIQNIKTQEEARQYAIDWQAEFSTRKVSMIELVDEQAELLDLALNFGLYEEFKENGII